jgi:hypothetical protein
VRNVLSRLPSAVGALRVSRVVQLILDTELSRTYENGRVMRLSLMVQAGAGVRDGAVESVRIGEEPAPAKAGVRLAR